MVDILHRVGIEGASPSAVHDALTTVDGVAGWWTDDTAGSSEVGGVLELRGGDAVAPGRADRRLALRPISAS